LEAFDCPPSYYQQKQWYRNPAQHWRVIQWLISAALQEVYSDCVLQQQPTHDTASTVEHETERTVPPATSQTETLETFPLGFATGDDDVDLVLIVLRMKLVVELEDEQRAINAAIAAAMTSRNKPALKPYKPRREPTRK
jgi:hypothetical protein